MIRRSAPPDLAALVALWERSVRASHHFLTEEDIASLRPATAVALADPALELWVLTDDRETPIGFLGLSDRAIEALFLDPACRGRGCGRHLVEFAAAERPGPLDVDVNEANAEARRSYEAMGFEAVGRSPVDDAGRPFPLVHMRRPGIADPRPGVARR